MKKLLERSAVVKETAAAQEGLHPAVEVLLFFGVFLVATCAEMFLMIPGMLVVLFTNQDFMAEIKNGTLFSSGELLDEFVSGEPLTIIMLFATAGMIAITLLFCRLLQRRKPRTLGFVKKDFWKEYLVGMAGGLLIFSAAVLICVVTGALKFESGISPNFSLGIFVLFFLGYLIQGMAEEVLCRGYFMGSFARRAPLFAAVLANSILFACLHLMNAGISALALVNLTLFGVFASVYFLKRGNIWGCGALHSIWNLVQGNVYGIKVSGTGSACTILESTSVEGKELINGGAFGLEGGLAVTVVLAAGIILLCCLKMNDKGAQAS